MRFCWGFLLGVVAAAAGGGAVFRNPEGVTRKLLIAIGYSV